MGAGIIGGSRSLSFGVAELGGCRPWWTTLEGVCLRQNQCMEAMLRDEGCLVTLLPSWSETGVLGLMSLRLPKDARWADGELIVFSGQLELAFCFL